jgi:hypothetical protein
MNVGVQGPSSEAEKIRGKAESRCSQSDAMMGYLNFSRFSLASGVLFSSNSNSLHGKSEHLIQEL